MPTPAATAWRWRCDREDSLKITRLRASDLADAQTLLGELGYEVDSATLTTRIKDVLGRDDHAAFMARDDDDGTALGLLHLYVRSGLEKPIEAYIQSLVVGTHARRKGVATTLMNVADAWARKRGLASIALHTQTHRADALAFYTAQGYAEVTQSRMLRKKL